MYIGEAEAIKDRVKVHLEKDYWNQIIFFISKDENLTKAHIRYCEGRLIEIAKKAGRAILKNSQSSGSKLPESDREDMEVFLEKMQQILPVLGIDTLVPAISSNEINPMNEILLCEIKGLKATGYLTPNGFVILHGSQAVLTQREACSPWISTLRNNLKDNGTLLENENHLVFSKDTEFSSPSAAAAVIHGGNANGLTAWKNAKNETLKQIESKKQN